jgi:hypothetical protein
VPSFSENEALPDGTHPPVWFAFDETRPLAVFAGIWTRWTDVQGTGARLRMPESLGHGHAAVEKTTLHSGTSFGPGEGAVPGADCGKAVERAVWKVTFPRPSA